jgi:hypothetical protein
MTIFGFFGSRRPIVLGGLAVSATMLALAPALVAQAPTRAVAPRAAAASDRLPVRRVVLYKSGSATSSTSGGGGNQTVTIDSRKRSTR